MRLLYIRLLILCISMMGPSLHAGEVTKDNTPDPKTGGETGQIQQLIRQGFDYMQLDNNPVKADSVLSLAIASGEMTYNNTTMLEAQRPVDSLALMWLQLELEEISYHSMEALNEMNMDRLLGFADKHNQKKLRDFALTLYRSYLIQAERLDKLKVLYLEKYPREFESLRLENPGMYHRILALFLEKEGRTEDAYEHWKTSESLLERDPNKIFTANFYIRFGQFFSRHHHTREAIQKFETALRLSKEAAYLEYAITASELLETAYLDLGDYKNAHTYARLFLAYKDSLNRITKKDDLLKLDIDNTTLAKASSKKRFETGPDFFII